MTDKVIYDNQDVFRLLGCERVYLSLCKVADTPLHIQSDDIMWRTSLHDN